MIVFESLFTRKSQILKLQIRLNTLYIVQYLKLIWYNSCSRVVVNDPYAEQRARDEQAADDLACCAMCLTCCVCLECCLDMSN